MRILLAVFSAAPRTSAPAANGASSPLAPSPDIHPWYSARNITVSAHGSGAPPK